MSAPLSHRAFTHTVDTMSAAAIVGSIAGYLPALAALAGVLWYGIQIWESKTVQKRVRAWKVRQIRARREKKAPDASGPDQSS